MPDVALLPNPRDPPHLDRAADCLSVVPPDIAGAGLVHRSLLDVLGGKGNPRLFRVVDVGCAPIDLREVLGAAGLPPPLGVVAILPRPTTVTKDQIAPAADGVQLDGP